MNLNQFCQYSDLLGSKELEKVRLLSFFFHKTVGKYEFTKDDILSWFKNLNLPKPNLSRLTSNIHRSRAFVKGETHGTFKLHAIEFDELQAQYPGLHIKSEEIIAHDTILPRSLYEKTRGFIESLAKQINASYEFNIFDGCAVLMRRLLEVLLILSYENLNIDTEIQDSQQNYHSLEKIINNALSNKKLRLSRDSKRMLDTFRTLGNFSAHKIYYNCRRPDLEKAITIYRATVEELLYKSGIRT
ncbi:unnamed protein product [marine sediment metagenome]|uniref:DUF4145 domain-containing protein n=1 Tax=marine sediment metagenome TaxID=412755 RepID=X0SC07_9ZZZZ